MMNEAELRREFDHWYEVHHISEDSHKDAAWQAYQLGYEAGQKDGPEEEVDKE